MSNKEIFIAIAIVAAITFAIRTFPIFFFSGDRKLPAVVADLGALLPYSMMALLVVYCLRTMHFRDPSGFVPLLAGSAITAISYKAKHNLILSIVLGTGLYMFLIQGVFL
ncbi:Predicted membrane protein [Aedoeadaptatus ivorii]|uniref:Predicted membrane protein n=1 Tax=Aedoeadaptatus ivorii TaxID=54006 RepID=A0A3S4ZR95_9FIRM|nr:AzlD domain-containing protein [Peptoniphilus ivorii]MDQ0508802.1 branched-subunit amino acid transport protein AzlD [Peptoniphilus ivorii]VEJ36078.1 Predicted membrane protein [Peptoniphilus ivorii]